MPRMEPPITNVLDFRLGKALYTFVTCSYEINDARTFLFAVEADEQGNEITADEEYQQKMTDLMIKKAEEAEAVSKEAGKK